MGEAVTSENIQKLRRSALAFGLILLCYSLAEIKINTQETVKPIGIPLNINNPNLLGIGLLLGTIYGLCRYWLYAIILGLSPRKARKRLSSGYLIDLGINNNSNNMSETDFGTYARKDIDLIFPKYPKKHISFTVEKDSAGIFRIKITRIPKVIHLLAHIQDLDFYSPIWFNLLAIYYYVLYIYFN